MIAGLWPMLVCAEAVDPDGCLSGAVVEAWRGHSNDIMHILMGPNNKQELKLRYWAVNKQVFNAYEDWLIYKTVHTIHHVGFSNPSGDVWLMFKGVKVVRHPIGDGLIIPVVY